jgi:hypothetical protein
MKKMLVAILIVITLIPCSGCRKKDESTSVIQNNTTITEINLSTVKTKGNRSYIPLNLAGRPSDNVDLILSVLDKFEKENADKKVTTSKFSEQQNGYLVNPFTFGIWVDHEPRTKP